MQVPSSLRAAARQKKRLQRERESNETAAETTKAKTTRAPIVKSAVRDLSEMRRAMEKLKAEHASVLKRAANLESTLDIERQSAAMRQQEASQCIEEQRLAVETLRAKLEAERAQAECRERAHVTECESMRDARARAMAALREEHALECRQADEALARRSGELERARSALESAGVDPYTLQSMCTSSSSKRNALLSEAFKENFETRMRTINEHSTSYGDQMQAHLDALSSFSDELSQIL
jgi:hypothetical protein